ncbi:MAG: hypothetical protein RR280_01160 [Bacteroidaceae bacterium]
MPNISPTLELGTKVVYLNTAEGDFRGMEDNIWEVFAMYPRKVHLKSLQNPEFTGFLSDPESVRLASDHEVRIGRAVRSYEKAHATTAVAIRDLIAKIDSAEVRTLAHVKHCLYTLLGEVEPPKVVDMQRVGTSWEDVQAGDTIVLRKGIRETVISIELQSEGTARFKKSPVVIHTDLGVSYLDCDLRYQGDEDHPYDVVEIRKGTATLLNEIYNNSARITDEVHNDA